ncbi:hypothetical protein [Ciceribacter azotifigens]|uniref:hypothetical protein n=1 Tax=Ciceribacter azotifigens TaxID=2069303 RepID=UPI003A8698AC
MAYAFGDFELHWEIVPQEDATILRLEHRGFDLENPRHRFAFENTGPAWRDVVLPRLAEGLLEAASQTTTDGVVERGA